MTPPAGPIAPTPGPEPRIAINATNTPGDADSLFKITQPGSYYLAGNITGVVGKHGIEIAASGVTIDLNGFELVGVAGMGPYDAVTATGNGMTDIEIRNGSVRDWGADGVDLYTLVLRNCVVADVRASGNDEFGIAVGHGSSVRDCTLFYNDVSIQTAAGCSIRGCTVYGSGGIATGATCTITGCAITASIYGIWCGSGCTIAGCSVSQSVTFGILAGAACSISDCTVESCGGNGISCGDGGNIRACTSRDNKLDGIVIGSQAIVTGNSCARNGNNGDGAGIHAVGDDNRIEGNNCTGADRGIDVDIAGNIIIRNTCSGNTTNWAIVANNKCLVVSGANAAAINGDSGGLSPGATDPNANFTY